MIRRPPRSPLFPSPPLFRSEHPAIVPVYDLGTRPDGSPYFTMKTIRGYTLADILTRLARGEADTEVKYPRARDRKSTRLNSSHLVISYAVFCLKKKKNTTIY